MEEINIGSAPNSKDGDSLRAAFEKINMNFANVSGASTITTVPLTAAGEEGDVVGNIAFDDSYFYFCTATYLNDSTHIWKRIAWDQGGW